MSIASEIARLQGAKAAIKAAIEAKGVSVSSSATLDDYPALIGAISGGGVTDIKWGTFTTQSNISSDYNIAHGLGAVPDTVIISTSYSGSTDLRVFTIKDSITNAYFGLWGKSASGNTSKVDLSSDTTPRYFDVDSTNITLKPTSTPWGAGTYLWIAIKQQQT